MLSDYEPIIWELPGRTIRVWAVADVHIGAETNLEAFRAFLRRVLADDDSFIVICGDMLDNAITGSVASVYGASPFQQVEDCAELLRPLAEAGKILGVVGGNHEARTKKAVDLDPLYHVCCLIGIPQLYRPNMAFVRIALKNGNMQDTYNLLLMHGASRAKRQKFQVEGVDVFITGHTHDPAVEKPARLVFTQRGSVIVQPMVHVVATSWLDFAGYAISKMYTPKATADPQAIELEFANTNTRRGRVRVTW